MIQQCRHCRDFYRMDDDDMAMENDDGALVSDVCRQCSDEFKHANGDAEGIKEARMAYLQALQVLYTDAQTAVSQPMRFKS